MTDTTTVPKHPKNYERKRKETQCPLCTCHFRSDLLVAHMLKHKNDLVDLLDVRCRTVALQEKIPLMFYHNSCIPKKQFNEAKMFCACLVCGKGKYKGGHGSVHDFLRLHRQSDCVKQWDSVAHLFGTLPEGVAPLVVEPEAPKTAPQEALKDRRIATLMASLEEKDAAAAMNAKRYNEMYTEHKRLADENIKLRNQLLEIQAAKASPPTSYDFDAVAPGVTLPAPVVAVKPEVAEPAPIHNTVPVPEPAPVAPAEDAPAPLPNANRPGYFLSKSGKWLKRAAGAPAPAPAPAPEPVTTYSQLPNPIVRNSGALKLPGMAQLAAPVQRAPAPMPKLLDASNFLANLMKEIDAPPSAAEVAKERARDIQELVDSVTFDLLENIVVYHWAPERVGAYIDKVQAEHKDIKLFDLIMEKKCGAVLQYVDGDDSEDCLNDIERLYEARR